MAVRVGVSSPHIGTFPDKVLEKTDNSPELGPGPSVPAECKNTAGLVYYHPRDWPPACCVCVAFERNVPERLNPPAALSQAMKATCYFTGRFFFRRISTVEPLPADQQSVDASCSDWVEFVVVQRFVWPWAVGLDRPCWSIGSQVVVSLRPSHHFPRVIFVQLAPELRDDLLPVVLAHAAYVGDHVIDVRGRRVYPGAACVSCLRDKGLNDGIA